MNVYAIMHNTHAAIYLENGHMLFAFSR